MSLGGLSPGGYDLYPDAPSNLIVPTVNMVIDGVLIASIPGDLGGQLIEGTSFVRHSMETDGAITIFGGGLPFSGLAGIQVVRPPEPAFLHGRR